MLSNIGKAQKLQEAIELIHKADALMQEALGASDEVYYIHTQLENAADDLADCAEQLVEMQITD